MCLDSNLTPLPFPCPRYYRSRMYLLDRACKTIFIGFMAYWTYGLVARLVGV